VERPRAVEVVDVREAARRMAEAPGAAAPLLVDVREANEFVQLRAEGAVLLPLSSFLARYRELPPDRPLLLICASGSRSFGAADYLLRNGFPRVANVQGGTVAWARAGLPVRQGPPAPGERELPQP
jgi:rhodanese-related sulfurtransferase